LLFSLIKTTTPFVVVVVTTLDYSEGQYDDDVLTKPEMKRAFVCINFYSGLLPHPPWVGLGLPLAPSRQQEGENVILAETVKSAGEKF